MIKKIIIKRKPAKGNRVLTFIYYRDDKGRFCEKNETKERDAQLDKKANPLG